MIADRGACLRGLALLIGVWAPAAAAQQASAPLRADSARDTTAAASVAPAALPPTAAQLHFLQAVHTAGRGVAQLRDGVGRVGGSLGSADRARAGQRLGGLCGAARGFLTSGRGRMDLTAYDDTAIQQRARVLAAQLDTLIKALPGCEAGAARQPDSTAASLTPRLQMVEAAMRDLRGATLGAQAPPAPQAQAPSPPPASPAPVPDQPHP